jgi:sodium/proline symporter
MNQFIQIPKPGPEYYLPVAIGVILFFIICIVIGLRARKTWSSYEEYVVGHRNIGPVVTGLALSASWLSGWAYLGSMGVTYTAGWSGMYLASMFSLFGIIPCLLFTALKLRKYSVRLGYTTIPEALGKRFGNRAVQIIAGIVILYYYLGYSIGQLKAGATCWYAVAGLSPVWCLLFSVVITWLYLAYGGYTGNQWVMAVQGALVGTGALLVGLVALYYVGGPAGLNTKLVAQGPNLVQLIRSDLPTVGPTQAFTSWVGIFGTLVLFIVMGSGFPHTTSRFLGSREITKKDMSILILMVWLVAGFPIFFDSITGLSARAVFGPALFKVNPWKADLAGPFISMVSGGPIVSTIYVIGLFAAALSTLAAMVFVMVTSVTVDIVKAVKPSVNDRTLHILGRILTAFFVFIPFVFTLFNPPPLLTLLMAQVGVAIGSTFFFSLIVSLYWKRATVVGVIACMIYCLAASIVFSFLIANKTIGMGTVFLIVSGGAGIVYFLGSLVSSPPKPEILKLIFDKD